MQQIVLIYQICKVLLFEKPISNLNKNKRLSLRILFYSFFSGSIIFPRILHFPADGFANTQLHTRQRTSVEE